jgi:hypothetical protein
MLKLEDIRQKKKEGRLGRLWLVESAGSPIKTNSKKGRIGRKRAVGTQDPKIER